MRLPLLRTLRFDADEFTEALKRYSRGCSSGLMLGSDQVDEVVVKPKSRQATSARIVT